MNMNGFFFRGENRENPRKNFLKPANGKISPCSFKPAPAVCFWYRSVNKDTPADRHLEELLDVDNTKYVAG